MNTVLYFAYGSNILMSRLVKRVGECKYMRSYRLYGYKLAFNAVGFGRVSYANIIPATKYDYVEGILYYLTPEQFKQLDRYEALYERQYFVITGTDYIGCTYIAEAYHLEEGVPSDRDYVETIMQGCKDFGLHKAYADAQKQLSNTNVTYKGKLKSVKKNGRTTFSVSRGFHW